MREGSLSRRYAKALFRLAQEDHREEEIGREIEIFLTAYTSSSLPAVLNNPSLGGLSRKGIVIKIAKHLQLSSTVSHFFSLLLERDRLVLLPTIVSHYRRLLDQARGRVEAQVVSAAPLSEALLERLRGVLGKTSGKEVILHAETDPEILGGMVVQLGGRIYDGSVRTQLQKMEERIERGY